MNVQEELTRDQKNQLIELRIEYMQLIKSGKETPFLRQRINEIDEELKEIGKSMPLRSFD